MAERTTNLNSVPSLILASQSPQRKAMLQSLGIPFTTVPADLDEAAIQDVDPIARAEKLASAKADTVSALHPTAVVIAADTFVVSGNQTFEKPRDLKEARQMLRFLSGKTLTEVTGLCVVDPHHSYRYATAVQVQCTFRILTEAEIERYVTTQPVTTWSAAFSPAYPEGAAFIAQVHGSLTGFTHGLPMEEVVEQLRKCGLLPAE
jgi:septum formation protein